MLIGGLSTRSTGFSWLHSGLPFHRRSTRRYRGAAVAAACGGGGRHFVGGVVGANGGGSVRDTSFSGGVGGTNFGVCSTHFGGRGGRNGSNIGGGRGRYRSFKKYQKEELRFDETHVVGQEVAHHVPEEAPFFVDSEMDIAISVPKLLTKVGTSVTPAVNRPVGMVADDMPCPRGVVASCKVYARMDTGVPVPVPPLPFSSNHDVFDIVYFTSAFRDAVASMRVACDNTHPELWILGWEKYLERHVRHGSRSASPQATSITRWSLTLLAREVVCCTPDNLVPRCSSMSFVGCLGAYVGPRLQLLCRPCRI